jgi:hypothetical protein
MNGMNDIILAIKGGDANRRKEVCNAKTLVKKGPKDEKH